MNSLPFIFSQSARFALKAFCLVFAVVVFMTAAPQVAAAETFITDANSEIVADTTWTKAESPYVISTGVYVDPGVTLTLEPGTILKFDGFSNIVVGGAIIAQGTPTDRIYFTSLYDDSVGGDTNGDGSDTFPSPNDHWGVYIIHNPSVPTPSHFSYFSFQYSSNGLWINNSTVSFSHGSIEHVGDGIGVSASSIFLNDVLFSDVDGDTIDGFNGSVFSIASTSISDIWHGDGFGFYQESTAILDRISVNGIWNGDGLGFYQGSTATLDKVSISDVWNGDALVFYQGSTATLDKVSVKNIGDGSALGLYGSTVTISNSLFDTGLDDAIELYNSYDFYTGERIPSVLSMSTSTVSNFLGSGLSLFYSQAKITNSVISKNDYGVDYYISSLQIASSAIADNASYGLYNETGEPISVVGNFWGDPSGPYNMDSNLEGLGNEVYGNVAFAPWLTEDPTKDAKPDPVIIIPGLLGSAQKNGTWVIDPIFHVYDNLIDTLKTNGYVEGKDLFTFPYDWEKSNVDSAILLRSKIASVLSLCACAKVDLVAHSMGGLIARSYIQSPAYAHDVDQLIFLGTPHLGAPKAYLTWEAGESAPDSQDRFLNLLLTKEAEKAGYFSLRAYIQAKPIASIRQLLPTFDYIHDVGTTTLRAYPNDYPRNTFLEDLNGGVSSLLNSGVRIVNIIGDTGTSTISAIRIVPSNILPLWQHGLPEGFYVSTSTDKGLELGRGDGTVPLKSSEFVDANLQLFNFSHIDLPSKSEGFIYKELTKKEPIKLIDKSRLFNLKMLFVKILSPADIVVVVAPNGQRIGKDFATGNEVNEIEDAFYSGYTTDDEYVTIPNPQDGEYQVITQGTGSGGEYTIATGLVSDTVFAESSFSGQTAPGMITPINIVIDSSSPQAVEVKPLDALSPVITITSPQSKNYIRGDIISINATSTDSDSGLFSFNLFLNGRAVQSGVQIDSFFEKLGNQMFVATATDYVGNLASMTVSFRITATPSSAIADVERAFNLGWITKKDVKNDIIEKLRQAIRIEKRIEILEEKLSGKPKIVKRIERLEERFDKVLGRAIIKDLEKKRLKYINDKAYDLLVEDINWLINN